MVILAVLAILILLVFFLPYGVDVGYADEVLRVGIKAGPLRIWLLPKKPLTEKQRLKAEAKKAKKEARRAARAAKKAAAAKEKEINDSVTVKPKPKLDFDTIVALLRMGSHAIRRFFRSFTVNFFQLHYTVACRDPYDTAIQYGMGRAPRRRRSRRWRERRSVFSGVTSRSARTIHRKSRRSLRASVLSLQLFRLVHLAVALGVEFLKWKINSRPEDKPAAATNERKDDNGRE